MPPLQWHLDNSNNSNNQNSPPQDDRQAFVWYTGSATQSIKGPIYPGAKDGTLVTIEVLKLQPSLNLFISDAPESASDQTLCQLYSAFLDQSKTTVGDTINYSKPEIGIINGVRFARGTFTAKITIGAIYPGAATNSYGTVDATGVCYVAIIDGKDFLFAAIAPKGESIEQMEQSILTFHQAPTATTPAVATITPADNQQGAGTKVGADNHQSAPSSLHGTVYQASNLQGLVQAIEREGTAADKEICAEALFAAQQAALRAELQVFYEKDYCLASIDPNSNYYNTWLGFGCNRNLYATANRLTGLSTVADPQWTAKYAALRLALQPAYEQGLLSILRARERGKTSPEELYWTPFFDQTPEQTFADYKAGKSPAAVIYGPESGLYSIWLKQNPFLVYNAWPQTNKIPLPENSLPPQPLVAAAKVDTPYHHPWRALLSIAAAPIRDTPPLQNLLDDQQAAFLAALEPAYQKDLLNSLGSLERDLHAKGKTPVTSEFDQTAEKTLADYKAGKLVPVYGKPLYSSQLEVPRYWSFVSQVDPTLLCNLWRNVSARRFPTPQAATSSQPVSQMPSSQTQAAPGPAQQAPTPPLNLTGSKASHGKPRR